MGLNLPLSSRAANLLAATAPIGAADGAIERIRKVE
jgi:hypothetical protein